MKTGNIHGDPALFISTQPTIWERTATFAKHVTTSFAQSQAEKDCQTNSFAHYAHSDGIQQSYTITQCTTRRNDPDVAETIRKSRNRDNKSTNSTLPLPKPTLLKYANGCQYRPHPSSRHSISQQQRCQPHSTQAQP